MSEMRIFVRVKPRSRHEAVKKIDEQNLQVCVKEPAEEGKANCALIGALARHFNVSSSAIKIIAGKTARRKVIEIKTTP